MRTLTLLAVAARPTVRAARVGSFLAGAIAGWVLLAIPAVLATALDPESLTLQLRLATVCAAVGVVFLLDDPAKPTTVVVPVPAWVPTAVRVVFAVVASGVWWAVAVGIVLAGAEDGVGRALRLPGTGLEAAAMVAVALALAVFGTGLVERGVASPVTGPALLGLFGGLALLPRGVALFVGVGDPGWGAAHDRWAVVLAGAAVAVAATAARRR
ncbi:ABC transporter [Cryptosporangium phraense]|uniref:ABC transporter n=1 Tax=Cryptosporangium phraense TaxID=2593070 RepID=A0A545AM27_9ACTN|nr:ABC transporter [Cryptosporangium phraense]TQS42382.1 ABC transporter [Cryptosporangium phraense]